MQQLSWLHLSDLHYGMNQQEWLWPTIKELFYKDIAKLSERIGTWDLVIFTGDLTQAGTEEQFDDLSKMLEELWNVLSKHSPSPLFVCTPGNHDLLRPDPLDPTVQAFNNWHTNEQIRNRFWQSSDNDYKKYIDKCFNNYTNWYDSLAIPKPTTSKGFIAGDYSHIIETNGIRTGIVSLNTAFLQLTDVDYEKKLSIHPRQILDVCGNDPDKWCSNLDLSLLITHHGSNWLHPTALDTFKSQIFPPDRFNAHFYGHMHEPYTQDSSEYGSTQRRLRQGSSLFGNINCNNGVANRIHGYNAGRFKFDNDNIIEELYPRTLIKTHAGHYKICADNKFDVNGDEFITTTHPIKSKAHSNTTLPSDSHTTTTTNKNTNITAANEPDGINPHIDLFNTSNLGIQPNSIKIVRHIIKPLSQHKNIRCKEQDAFTTTIREQRCSILVSDWGYGKEGFLYSVLDKVNHDSLNNIYRVTCEDLSETEHLSTAFEDQLGISLQEFCVFASQQINTTLLLDDIPYSLITAGQNATLNTATLPGIIRSVLDFCPSIKIILTTRQYSDNFSFSSTIISPLEPHEIREYLSNHPNNSINHNDPDLIEILHMRSGGLPMRIDSILENIQITSIDSIFDVDMESTSLQEIGKEPVPKALIQAVSSIENSDDIYAKRGFKLLKVLSVLSDGEMLNTVKWFYPGEPFQTKCGIELLKLSLISRVEQPNIIKEITSSAKGSPHSYEVPMISVKVPRQVRDYVLTLIDDEELHEIIKRAAEILFGEKWRDGTIKILQSKSFSSTKTSFSGLGNEHRVIYHLLKVAMQKNDPQDIRRAATLGLTYCKKLHSINRYWDASISAEELLYLLENSTATVEYTKLAAICGKSLRMAGKCEKAIQKLNLALDSDQNNLTKEEKSDIHLGLALAYKHLNELELAQQSAETVQKLTKKIASHHLQAQAIITSITLSGDEKRAALKSIEKTSRKNKHFVVANNILLDLAESDGDSKQKIRYLDDVVKSSGDDPYNRIRATLNKASLYIEQNTVSQLSFMERIFIQRAYSFLFSQRLTSLFNQCHEVTWQLFKCENHTGKILRLFRYSSLLWRIRGILDKEQKYLSEISQISPDEIKQLKDTPVACDIIYAEARMSESSPGN